MQLPPILFALLATVSWGLWAFFAKLAGQTLRAEMTVVITYFVGAVLGTGYVLVQSNSVSVARPGLRFAVLSGVFFGIGGLSYYHALRNGSTTVITTVAALYFVVAALLAVTVLGEQLQARQVAGVVLATLSVFLLAT